eukprot:1196418-Prorocentrum_minimum.AAC.3
MASARREGVYTQGRDQSGEARGYILRAGTNPVRQEVVEWLNKGLASVWSPTATVRECKWRPAAPKSAEAFAPHAYDRLGVVASPATGIAASGFFSPTRRVSHGA